MDTKNIHYISAPPNPGEQKPDFDQILSVSLASQDGSLVPMVYSVPGRPNEKSSKLSIGESVTLLRSTGARVDIKVLSELLVHAVGTDR